MQHLSLATTFSFFFYSKHFFFFPFCCVNQIVLEMDALVCVCVWNCPESRFLGVFEEEQSNTMVLLLILPFSFRKTKTKSGSKSDLDLHRFTAGLLLLTVLLALPPGPENSQWELHYSCKSHFNKHTHTRPQTEHFVCFAFHSFSSFYVAHNDLHSVEETFDFITISTSFS